MKNQSCKLHSSILPPHNFGSQTFAFIRGAGHSSEQAPDLIGITFNGNWQCVIRVSTTRVSSAETAMGICVERALSKPHSNLFRALRTAARTLGYSPR